MNKKYVLYSGDCLEVMKKFPSNSVDSIVTDPPYGLSFMGKEWDKGVPGVPFWEEMLRVLKPGGYLLSFGGARTYHRMACAIEDSGFEIRDQIMWLYGTGFPKSRDISKDLDKMAGEKREVIGKKNAPGVARTNVVQGAQNRTVYEFNEYSKEPITEIALEWQGWGTALKPAHEPIVLARKPLIGTVAENVTTHGTGAINIDACRVGVSADDPNHRGVSVDYDKEGGPVFGGMLGGRPTENLSALGRFPANVIHDGSDEVLEAFAAYGELRARGNKGDSLGKGANDAEVYAGGWKDLDCGARYNHEPPGTVGTAARFFYSAKASKADRNGSKHPTVKPLALMRYLCRLITPPNGIVLDPFSGSGTTLQAAIEEGFMVLGIEKEQEYIEDIKRRLEGVNDRNNNDNKNR